MKSKEVLVIGAGVAGCAVALALAKRGVAVTIITSLAGQQQLYASPLISRDRLEESVKNLSQGIDQQVVCSRAYEQLIKLGLPAVGELLSVKDGIESRGDMDIHCCLLEQLNSYSHVEWLHGHTAVELLTLEQHSSKMGDRHKKPTCIGARVYCHDTGKMEIFLAKETVLATGGASSLFPYSAYRADACGSGIAMAYRAGARLLNMEQVQFHLFGLYEKNHPCFPLPVEFFFSGGKLYDVNKEPFELNFSGEDEALSLLYDKLTGAQSENFWLDLTAPELARLRENFPLVDAYFLNRGFNMVKDLLPVVPFVADTCGGIAVDKFGQSTLQRLRAVGGVACTGLFEHVRSELLKTLESLVWAVACAEDIVKGINKFAFYFPDLKEKAFHWDDAPLPLKEDWILLRQIMWFYGGICRTQARSIRGAALLEQLADLNKPKEGAYTSIEHIQLCDALQTAQLMI